ncbi:MAG: GHKL domain-containing protein [Sulfuritalea sp.]|nr:GHKL domain-containing protein [Sulfuritalea sp.]
MIEQVIVNLVRNAIEAMTEVVPSRREIVIQTRLFESDSVEVEVADTGPGIEGGLIDQVFDQFFTTKPEGVGMGLAISRSIIESHGGKIRAESSRDGGAILRFTLKISAQQSHRRERADSIHS